MRSNAVKMICAAGILAAALFMSACDGGNGDIDLAPEPDLTTENDMEAAETVDRRVLTPFIMPKEGTEEYLHYSSKMDVDCVPGYLYLKNAAEDVFYLLTPYEFDEADGLYQYVREENGYVNWRYVYGVAKFPDGDKILAVDKMSGTFNIVYNSQSGRIELMTSSDRFSDDSSYLFFKDGNSLRYLIQSTGETIIAAESEVADIKNRAFVYERTNKGGIPEYDAFICDDCVDGFIIWADDKGQYYWHHVHSGENEPIDFQYLYYPFYCYNYFEWDGSRDDSYSSLEGEWGEWELYVRSMETREKTLLLDNVIYYYANDFYTHKILAIVRSDGVNRFVEVDERTGEVETLYEFQSGDLELLRGDFDYMDEIYRFVFKDGDRIFRVYGYTPEKDVVYEAQQPGLEIIGGYTVFSNTWLIRDGNWVIKMSAEKLETEVLFEAENGITDAKFFEYYAAVRYNMMEYYPDVDLSELYNCEQCDNDVDYVIWSDNDGNWFWYHPHSGENTPIMIDEESYTAISFWDGQEYPIPYITKVE